MISDYYANFVYSHDSIQFRLETSQSMHFSIKVKFQLQPPIIEGPGAKQLDMEGKEKEVSWNEFYEIKLYRSKSQPNSRAGSPKHGQSFAGSHKESVIYESKKDMVARLHEFQKEKEKRRKLCLINKKEIYSEKIGRRLQHIEEFERRQEEVMAIHLETRDLRQIVEIRSQAL